MMIERDLAAKRQMENLNRMKKETFQHQIRQDYESNQQAKQ